MTNRNDFPVRITSISPGGGRVTADPAHRDAGCLQTGVLVSADVLAVSWKVPKNSIGVRPRPCDVGVSMSGVRAVYRFLRYRLPIAGAALVEAPAATLPGGEPRSTADGLLVRGPRIEWDRVEIAADTPVQRYLVSRHLGPVTQLACDIPVDRHSCVDEHPRAGCLVTYSVVAAHGAFWTGPAGRHSPPIPLPGEPAPVVVDGVVVLPGAGDGRVPPPLGSGAAAPAGAGAADDAGAVAGPATPAPVPVPTDSEPAPAIVPPAPPEPEQGTTAAPVEPPTDHQPSPSEMPVAEEETADQKSVEVHKSLVVSRETP
ncbi:hypothetical protein [Couchioplanes caeruleus]|uniref:hypothetical protein n=1 Tax=Couchioplanes caeruleus TaxID=56438 RepID=UPI001B86B545|nr:hypothetical protein [Couchioplanes caeruleus]